MPDDEPKTAAITSRSAVVATLLLAGAIIVLVVLLQGCGGSEDSAEDDATTGAAPAGGPVLEGVGAPDFTLTSLEGEAVSLSDFAGRPLLVNFWASWCPPCREEFPVLAQARAAHLDEGFEILGVTRNDQPEYSRKFAEESDAQWPILPDPADDVWTAYGPVGLPTSYFIDAEGIVQRVHIGPVNEEQLANHLEAIGLS